MLEEVVKKRAAELLRLQKLACLRFYRTGEGRAKLEQINRDFTLINDLLFDAKVSGSRGSTVILCESTTECVNLVDSENNQLTFEV